ncbi:unnamed protein product [Heligmosomoides polygyrus]|uniref:EB domain-containing protein n=1 Tax=Heligmosomoides polygyrus TaxID=6339 RepID=A0A3P7XNI1_HELPZ|nr:unnamed protein product [Heligmosomoides polygyrus]
MVINWKPLETVLTALVLCADGYAQNCASDSACPSGMQCVAVAGGYSICSQIGDGVKPNYPTPPAFYCNGDRDCAPSQVCVRVQGQLGSCLDSRAVSCRSDIDCSFGQTCAMLSNLQTACQIVIGGLKTGGDGKIQVGNVGLSCKRDSDCGANMRCVDYYGHLQCMANDLLNNVDSASIDGGNEALIGEHRFNLY